MIIYNTEWIAAKELLITDIGGMLAYELVIAIIEWILVDEFVTMGYFTVD